jgi:hypothetical protein
LAWGDVSENQAGVWQVRYFVAGFDAAAEGFDVMRQSVAEGLCASANDGPAGSVSSGDEDKDDRSGGGGFEREDGVTSYSSEECASSDT